MWGFLIRLEREVCMGVLIRLKREVCVGERERERKKGTEEESMFG